MQLFLEIDIVLSFLEVNTELTKAELLYRNGEYTKALSTAVDIIEKIKPDSYEMLVNKKVLRLNRTFFMRVICYSGIE
mgnify:CR=1 FL=1